MQLTGILVFATCLQVSAAAFGQKVTITGRDISMKQVFKDIRKQTGYNFLYTNRVIRETFPVTINLQNVNVKQALDKIISDQPITYTVDDKIIIIKSKPSYNGSIQQKLFMTSTPVSGVVRDSATGKPLEGVSIQVKGTTTGTTTGTDGKFSLNVPDNAILIISYLGYKKREISVDRQATIEVELAPSSTGLNEVIVTALGIKRESRALGYAVQQVSGNELQTVKGVDVGTSLTGKVAGLTVKNSTEFDATPAITLRGETPMLVIDGVPYENMTLRDIPADNIKSITVLKGPTAAALYGSRGANGAIMITTKGGTGQGLSVEINSNTMISAGYLAIPKVQTHYGHGIDGHISTDYVWGPRLDMGDSAMQWNPIAKKEMMMPLVSSGKNNLKNFLQTSVITNNNISVTQSGKNGYFRASLNHIFDKGQWPNTKLNIINYSMGGELRIGDKFSLESHMGYTFQKSPQIWGQGYGAQGYLYQILMWTGPDYDIRQYKDYWVIPNVKQNWLYNAWYDNPYLIAYQKLDGIQKNKLNASLTANYHFTKDLNLMFRSGYDFYKNEETVQSPAGINSTRGGSAGNTFSWNYSGKGMYGMDQMWGFSTNNDLILTYNKTLGKFDLNALAGGSINYYIDREFGGKTVNGLAIPGWYSLANAVPSTTAGVNSINNNYGTWSQQVNSLYGKLSFAWDDAIYLDLTGRNDWSSTQPIAQRSYFYPSASLSLILSHYVTLPRLIDMWKVRGSWTEDKTPAGIYDNNRTFSTGTSWGLPSSSYPSNLLGTSLLPSASRTWEVGTESYLFGQRLHIDIAYFRKYYYDQQIKASISDASGYTSTLINTHETYARKGLEITLDGSPIKHRDFEWHSLINYSFQHRYYVNLDPVYSADNLWTQKSARLDTYVDQPFLRTADGKFINVNGFPAVSDYDAVQGYTEPAFSFGFVNNITFHHFTLGISIDGRVGGSNYVMYDYIWNKMFDSGSNPATDTKWRYDQVVDGLTNYVGPGVMVTGGAVTYDKYGRVTSDTRKYAPNNVAVGYQSYEQYLNDAATYEHGLKNPSFVKLREISIGYDIPQIWLSGTGIKSASLSLTAQNFLMWTQFPFSDPDVGDENLNAPSMRMVGFNVKVTF